ncbi:hypothetical protein ACQFN5_03285 [Klebsiella sp. WOUb02]|uniref:hypothetical protein n=1 Tax=Klebsiella sp. WOUb02 TaxID=3161071 RepID=UPI00314F4CB4
MSFSVSRTLERHIEYPALGVVNTSTFSTELIISVNSVGVMDETAKLAVVAFSLTLSTDSTVSLTREELFTYSDSEALAAEAESFLISLYNKD